SQDPEAEAARRPRFVEVADREGVLGGTARAVIECRQEAVAAQARIEPVRAGRTGHNAEFAAGARIHRVLARLGRALFALLCREALVEAALANQLARLPAHRQIGRGRFRAAQAFGCLQRRRPRPVLLGVAVAGVDLDQELPLRILLRALQL